MKKSVASRSAAASMAAGVAAGSRRPSSRSTSLATAQPPAAPPPVPPSAAPPPVPPSAAPPTAPPAALPAAPAARALWLPFRRRKPSGSPQRMPREAEAAEFRSDGSMAESRGGVERGATLGTGGEGLGGGVVQNKGGATALGVSRVSEKRA
eukprot:scaffold1201_cov125-Isochrysis_galbana.AAC.1